MAKTIILGAGPCGLGAAWRLKEKNYDDFLVLEAGGQAGGLATSFKDREGFTWDIGGHVQFSHYEDFDSVMDKALPNAWLYHQRESWVWIQNRFVPYPFQYNIWRLEDAELRACIDGLRKASHSRQNTPHNFGEWIDQSFGQGLAQVFMRPYNFKVWAYPPELMSYKWIGERVATVDLDRLEKNIAEKKDDVSWGPNSTFRFPEKGGTGAIWKSVAQLIGHDKIKFNEEVVSIDPEMKLIKTRSGNEYSYEQLLSTISLDRMMTLAGLTIKAPLLSSNSHIVGIGLKGQKPETLKTKCWMYFPESNCPFYRVTVFSNYSPNNVPDADVYWSLMCETSESEHKPVDQEKIVADTIQGLKNTKLISDSDQIVSKWYFCAKPGYPTPGLGRDEIVDDALEQLGKFSIYSRGRFGCWRYEVSNQDHTFMQGFEWADWMLEGHEEMTYCRPSIVNAAGKRPARPADWGAS